MVSKNPHLTISISISSWIWVFYLILYTFYFEMNIDAQGGCKNSAWSPVNPSPSFLQKWRLLELQYNIKPRKRTLVWCCGRDYRSYTVLVSFHTYSVCVVGTGNCSIPACAWISCADLCIHPYSQGREAQRTLSPYPLDHILHPTPSLPSQQHWATLPLQFCHSKDVITTVSFNM